MPIFRTQPGTQAAVNTALTRLRRARLQATAGDAAARVWGTVLAVQDWLDQHDLSPHTLAGRVTDAWWAGTDWALRQPFEWAATRAQLYMKAYQWDLDGRADRLLTWAAALEALAHAHRALRDHPDIPEDNGVVEHLENQALLLRAMATADRARFLHSQSTNSSDQLPARRHAAPEIETLVGAHLDQLSNASTTHDERIVHLAQLKALLAPTLGNAVQVLHHVC